MIDRIASFRLWPGAILLVVFALVFPLHVQADEPLSGGMAEAAVQRDHGPDHEDDGAGGGHGQHHETGVPINFKGDLALWSLVVFLLLVALLKRFAWEPLIHGLDNREAGIRRAIAEAEENRRKSEVLLAEYDQRLKVAEQTVQAMVSEAKRDAERTAQDLIAATQKEVGAIRERARHDIELARDTALSELFDTINQQVMLATEHVLGRALNEQDQDRLVDEAVAGISR